MTEQTTILAPLRYPLTTESAQTLAAAGHLADEHAPAALRVLHVNLLQKHENIRTEEFTRAISATLDDVDATVHTRRGFLVEEIILDEVTLLAPDIVVVGANQQSRWRKFLRRVFGNDPAVGSFLRDNAADTTEIVEVETGSEISPLESV